MAERRNKLINAGNLGGVSLSGLAQKAVDETITGSWTFDGTTFNIGDPGTESGSITVNGASFTAKAKVNHFGGTVNAEQVFHHHSSTPSNSANVLFARSKGDTSAHSDVASGDYLGQMNFAGWNTSSYYLGAVIHAAVAGTPGVSDMPTNLVFSTSADGSATPATRLTLNSTGATIVGDVSGTTIGGITEANLLDKTATETITGAWTFDGFATTITNGYLLLDRRGDAAATYMYMDSDASFAKGIMFREAGVNGWLLQMSSTGNFNLGWYNAGVYDSAPIVFDGTDGTVDFNKDVTFNTPTTYFGEINPVVTATMDFATSLGKRQIDMQSTQSFIHFNHATGPSGIAFGTDTSTLGTAGGTIVWRSSPNQLIVEKHSGVDLLNIDFGTGAVTVASGPFTASQLATFSNDIQANNGSVSGPSYTFSSNTDCGFYIAGSTMAQTIDGTQTWAYTATENASKVRLRVDGNELRVSNAADTDYADFSHNGTDFTTSFVNTGNWIIDGSGMTAYVDLRQAPLRVQTDGTQGLFEAYSDTGADGKIEIRGARNAPTAGVQMAQILLSTYDHDVTTTKSGVLLALEQPVGGDTNMNDLDFVIETRQSSALVEAFRISGGDIYVPGDIKVTGSIEEQSTTGVLNLYGGVSATGANIELYGGSHATQANNAFYDADAHTFRSQSAGATYFSLNSTQADVVGIDLRVRDGQYLEIWDAADTQKARFRHTGTNLGLDKIGTTNYLQLEDGIGLRVYDSVNTGYGIFEHDDTDFLFTFSGTTDLNISGVTLINSLGGSTLRVYDGTNVDYTGMDHNGTSGRIWCNAGTLEIGVGGNDQVVIRYNNQGNLKTRDESSNGAVSGAEVRHRNDTFYNVGFATSPHVTQDTDLSTAADWGNAQGLTLMHTSATPHTYTTPANTDASLGAGAWWNIINIGSGSVTIAAGTSVTLRWMNGANNTGSRTLAQYGWCRLWRRSASLWYILGGEGIT